MRIYKILKLSSKESGNISVVAVFLIILFAILFLILGDICRVFIVREATKKAADAVSLAVSQDILFFNIKESHRNAGIIAESNSCRLTDLKITYDKVLVTVEKDLDFLIIKSLYPGGCTIYASSCSRVIFPWDECFGFCDSYKFKY